MKTVRTAVAGLGRSGWDIHVQQLRRLRTYKVTDVIDRHADRLEQARRDLGCNAHTDWREFLKATKSELVILATPSHTHCGMACEAMKRGLHVLVEKPMALDAAEARKMIRVSRRTGRVLTVFQNRRLDPDFQCVQKAVRRGLLGEVFFVRIARYQFARRRDWQTLRDFGGGQLNNWGAHLIDQGLQLLASGVKEIFADIRLTVSAGDAEDHLKVVLKGENGPTVDVEITSACALAQPEYLVMGKRGTLSIEKGRVVTRRVRGRLKKIVASAEAPPDRSYGTGETIHWQEETKQLPVSSDSWTEYYRRLYQTLCHAKPLFVTPESACALLQVLDYCRKHA